MCNVNQNVSTIYWQQKGANYTYIITETGLPLQEHEEYRDSSVKEMWGSLTEIMKLKSIKKGPHICWSIRKYEPIHEVVFL